MKVCVILENGDASVMTGAIFLLYDRNDLILVMGLWGNRSTGTGARGRERGDGSVGTGVWGQDRGDGSVGTGARGREHGNGSMGTGAWGWHHGNGTMGTALWERHCGNGTISSKIFLHRMIEIIYFDGSIGTGGEGQQFFIIYFKKYFTSYDSNDLF